MWHGRRRLWPEGEVGPTPEPEDGRLVFQTSQEAGRMLRALARQRGQPPEALASEFLLHGLEREARRAEVEAGLAALTPRQRQVAWRAVRGQTNRQIARALVISPETVKTHLARVLGRFDVHSKAELRLLLLDLGVRWGEGDDWVNSGETRSGAAGP